MFTKIRAAANFLMVCIAIERSIAAIKRDRLLQQQRRRASKIHR